jgi:predicted dehydrogenase
MHREAWEGANAELITLDGAGAAAGYYGELSRVLTSRNAHAVSLCVPPATRRALAIDCLANRIHVLCELPLGGDLDSAEDLVSTAERFEREPGVLLMPATPLRFLPDVQFGRGIAGGGGLGDLKWFQLTLSPFIAPTGKESQHRSLSGAGLLFDLGSHAFDLVHHLFGRPSSVRSVRVNAPPGLGPAQAVQVRCSFASGLNGEVLLSTATGTERLLTLEGSEGVVEVGWTRSMSRLKGAGVTPFGSGNSLAAAYRQMIGVFQEIVAGRMSPWVTMGECRQILGMMRTAQRSLETGRTMDPGNGTASSRGVGCFLQHASTLHSPSGTVPRRCGIHGSRT